MGLETGNRLIYYNGDATSWKNRKFAIYLRQLQVTELIKYIDPSGLSERDPADVAPAPVTRNVRSLTRRRYPGGRAISVPATERTVIVGPSIKEQAWPGRPITLERPKAGGPYNPLDSDVEFKVLQLTLQGSFADFYLYCQQNYALTFILRTNHGRPLMVGSPNTVPTP